MEEETKAGTRPETGTLLKRVLLHCDNEYQMRIIEAALDILERDRGCNSPAEEFLEGLLRAYQCRPPGLTPDDVKEALQDFEENFIDFGEAVRDFVKAYPAVLSEPTSSEENEGEAHAE
jgi:hypothetical protein